MAKTILLVEDDPVDAIITQKALEAIMPQPNVLVEKNGVDAVLYLKGEAKFADRNKYPIPDVILLDLELPLFDGFEFLEWVRKESPARRVPVVVISGTRLAQSVARAYQLGATSFIFKTPNWELFKRTINATVPLHLGQKPPSQS